MVNKDVSAQVLSESTPAEYTTRSTDYVTINLPPEYIKEHQSTPNGAKIFVRVMLVVFVLLVILPIIDLLLQLVNPMPDAGFELVIIAPFFLATLAVIMITMPVLLFRYRSDSWMVIRAGAMLAISVLLLILIAIPKGSTL